MRQRSFLKASLLSSCLAIAILGGCAPEEEATGVLRPKTPTPLPTSTPQLNKQQLAGGIKDRGTPDTSAANPPPPEPSPFPSWTPQAPPSLSPIILPSTDPSTAPTPDVSPSSDPTPTVDPTAP